MFYRSVFLTSFLENSKSKAHLLIIDHCLSYFVWWNIFPLFTNVGVGGKSSHAIWEKYVNPANMRPVATTAFFNIHGKKSGVKI